MLDRPGNVDFSGPLGECCVTNSSSDADVHAWPEPVDCDAVADSITRADPVADPVADRHADADTPPHRAEADH